MLRQLEMFRIGTDKLPEVPLPEGYAIRKYQPGDEEPLAVMLSDNKGLSEWDAERVQRDLLSDSLAPGGVHLVTYHGKIVAHTVAQSEDNYMGQRYGRVGWVAADPGHSGKKLGLAVCTAVVNYLIDHGYDKIVLSTDAWRLPAIKIYLQMGFEPRVNGADDRYLWPNLSEEVSYKLTEETQTKIAKGPKGEEIAWRTLELEDVKDPCIIASWCMKREFFQLNSHKDDIYGKDAPDLLIKAFVRSGANLCPQFIMPSPDVEHQAANPFHVWEYQKSSWEEDLTKEPVEPRKVPQSPEDVRDLIEAMPDSDSLVNSSEFEQHADQYAKHLMSLRDRSRGEILFLGGFSMPDFMGGYNWGFTNYLSAFELYPEHLQRYFEIRGESARLFNMCVAEGIKKYSLAPFVYGGDDICYNEGPLCSIKTLEKMYFPNLARAVQPLHDAGIGVIWHCDGNVLPIMDQLINDVGVAGFQGFQEETGCTLEHIVTKRRRDGKKLILWGSISVTKTLPYGTIDDVKKDVERCFKVAAPGGGFALASSSSILPETPVGNIFAMYDHAERFGKTFLGG
ncbi:MAG: GNAT family N-acetyltransferase [bacterium]